ncbi:MAG TPA: 2-succinyl-5-enolpyruvyl-6-hydroxy-3-cyclohexene-1-carboxylic-acid synthase [Ignavibacteriaceae bacterium]|nr:2-succinyl-5-enolpyruvyl-6-hydroxy-3-cyclohexene-1-carboxylic-acid synthase [Ignavibacteriaceae bacterium]
MMKFKINRNILWTETFVNELVSIGLKYVCISPGSRNTPLTLAYAQNKKIKSHIIVDERSCAFFALGLAKSSGSPVALVCTSGTATAEFYPAIIEAYQQRIPLIVCTADRPPELIDVGANQTINQNNLYRNHIRWFIDAGLPEPTHRRIKHIKATARRAYYESLIRSKGPVHINFPFRKPFEPESYTDTIEKSLIEFSKKTEPGKENVFQNEIKNIADEKWFKEIYKGIKKYSKGLIIAGPENYNPKFPEAVSRLADKLGYPIFADGCSNIRFGKHNKEKILSNFDAFLRSKKFSNKNKPEFILHFGRTITSKALDTYLEKCNAVRYMVNDFGDWFDPSNKSIASFDCKPYIFCQRMNEYLDNQVIKRKPGNWLSLFLNADKTASGIKKKVIEKSPSLNEGRIIKELLDLLPQESHLMISNSMPVRDFDYFASNSDKRISIYNNRGASGIDGIISTALGINTANKPTILLTGDLAFYYDLNGLLAAKKYKIPLIIVLVNNDGGGIFEVLPVSDYGNTFKEFFKTPHGLDFSHFVKAYGGFYKKIKNWIDFKTSFQNSLKRNTFSVLEIKTDSSKSLKLRRKFWKEVSDKLP